MKNTEKIAVLREKLKEEMSFRERLDVINEIELLIKLEGEEWNTIN